MTALAEKLKEAGADTLGAKLTTACIDAIRLNPKSVEAAWRHVGLAFGHSLIRGLMDDMQPPRAARAERERVSRGPERAPIGQPVVIPAERIEKRRQLQAIVRSKYKNSGNVSWSDVGWHELTALERDGMEARALLREGPANVPNDGRTVGDVLGIKRTDEIIGSLRS